MEGAPGTCSGYASRYWDCCKPHCGWQANVPPRMHPVSSCSSDNESWEDNYTIQSSCDGGDAHTCFGLVPFAVSNALSYGFAATSEGDVCGRCYQLDFTSGRVAGKRMVVQAINLGYDVAGNQFDLLIPGGGLGLKNACANQWNVLPRQLGEQYGGFLKSCQLKYGTDDVSVLKSCVADYCDTVFGTNGLTELHAGCEWFLTWYDIADNPEVLFKEVVCPAELIEMTGMNRAPLHDINHSCD
ncbi:MAG: hypothetical protein JXR76_17290 [Deltaproteobacteria bacterium]|nr:hypothetical protein [Deltaproteobacteria bacterium]